MNSSSCQTECHSTEENTVPGCIHIIQQLEGAEGVVWRGSYFESASVRGLNIAMVILDVNILNVLTPQMLEY